MSEHRTKAKVMVVEDDHHLRESIRDILELEEYAVMTAENGQDALDVLRHDSEEPPNVIVSDIMMPRMGGFEFLEEVRKETQWMKIPFIFLTAKGEKADRYRGSLSGADDYLVKPFEPDDLLVSIASKLARVGDFVKVAEEEVSNVKTNILTILNHEFRTPLTLVVAYADMLKEVDTAKMSESELISFLKGVNSGAARLRRLVENFILLVELDSGDAARTYGWRKREQSIKDIIMGAYDQIMNPEVVSNECVVRIQDDLPPIVADREFMVIAIRELLDNAVKFCSPDQPIVVEATQEDDALVIRVIDEGRGIPADEQDKIWENFYQINREQFEDQGAGSGLAIVRGVVEMHGGSARVKSEVEVGSTFTIRLPLTQPETE